MCLWRSLQELARPLYQLPLLTFWIGIRTPSGILVGRFSPLKTVLSTFIVGVQRAQTAYHMP